MTLTKAEKEFIIERLLEEAERLEELSEDESGIKTSLKMIDRITNKLEKDVDTIKI